MSQTTTVSTSNSRFVETDVSKIFLFNRESLKATLYFDNYSGGTAVTLEPGTVLGRIASSDKVTPLDSSASDGSQFPVGILMQQVTVAANTIDSATEVYMCVAGDVAKGKIIFYNGTDTVATVVSDRTLGDRIGADTVGIRLVPSTEMTESDNS